MNKYTFITEFRGGTYISQVKETDLRAAMILWSRNLNLEQIQFLGEESLNYKKSLKNEHPTSINGVENGWFFL